MLDAEYVDARAVRRRRERGRAEHAVAPHGRRGRGTKRRDACAWCCCSRRKSSARTRWRGGYGRWWRRARGAIRVAFHHSREPASNHPCATPEGLRHAYGPATFEYGKKVIATYDERTGEKLEEKRRKTEGFGAYGDGKKHGENALPARPSLSFLKAFFRALSTSRFDTWRTLSTNTVALAILTRVLPRPIAVQHVRDRGDWHEYLARAVGLLTTSPHVLDERAFRGKADLSDEVSIFRSPWCLWKWRHPDENPGAPPFEEPLAFLCGPPAMTDEIKARSYTLVPIRPRRRGERRSLRTLSPGASLRPPLAFNTRPRRLSTPTDAFQLHPDVRSYGTTQSRSSR